jgi:hypothetical protein
VKNQPGEDHDRCIAFFKQLVADNPKAPNAWMNLGYAYVDKIPAEGAITQVLLANTALGHFSAALDLRRAGWDATRGATATILAGDLRAYAVGIADLEKLSSCPSRRKSAATMHGPIEVWAGAYWRLNDLEKLGRSGGRR